MLLLKQEYLCIKGNVDSEGEVLSNNCSEIAENMAISDIL